jgi:hypothetical protein
MSIADKVKIKMEIEEKAVKQKNYQAKVAQLTANH